MDVADSTAAKALGERTLCDVARAQLDVNFSELDTTAQLHIHIHIHIHPADSTQERVSQTVAVTYS